MNKEHQPQINIALDVHPIYPKKLTKNY